MGKASRYFCLAVFLFSTMAQTFAGASKTAPLGHGYEFAGNGKRQEPEQAALWQTETPRTDFSILHRSEARDAARATLEALDKKSPPTVVEVGGVKIRGTDLKTVAATVERWLGGAPDQPLRVRMLRTHGEDRRGNVHFTGYFTPLLPARRKADAEFRFPLYALPKNRARPWPARMEIDEKGALAGAGLELAWTNDLLELYFLHVQGSGMLEFGPEDRKWIECAGGNGHRYVSLGRLLVDRGEIPAESISLRAIRNWMAGHPGELVPMLYQNPAYTFFRWADWPTRGAAGVSLVAGHSVAADPKVFPLGSCLLGEVPELDGQGVLIGYSWRLLFVHDTGRAIRGPGHLDLYHGIGRELGDRAGDLHHYGRVWLLLPPD